MGNCPGMDNSGFPLLLSKPTAAQETIVLLHLIPWAPPNLSIFHIASGSHGQPHPQTKQKQRPQVQLLARQVGAGCQDVHRHDPLVLHPLACLFGEWFHIPLAGRQLHKYLWMNLNYRPSWDIPSAGITSVHLHAWLVPIVLLVSLFY